MRHTEKSAKTIISRTKVREDSDIGAIKEIVTNIKDWHVKESSGKGK